MQIRISGPGAIFTSAKCRCSVREEALAPFQIFARLAHACTRVCATFERVACCFRVAFQKGNPKRAPIPRFEKEAGEPFNAVGSLALWSLKDPPRATRSPPFFPPLLLPFLVLVSSTRLFGFLLVAFAFCSRWEGIEFYGRVEWYIRGIRQEELAYVIVFTYPLWGKYRLQKDLLFRR